MRNTLTAFLAGLGMALLIGGLLAFVGGIFQDEVRELHHLGPLNGIWDRHHTRFYGAIMAAIGSGLFTFAFLLRRGG